MGYIKTNGTRENEANKASHIKTEGILQKSTQEKMVFIKTTKTIFAHKTSRLKTKPYRFQVRQMIMFVFSFFLPELISFSIFIFSLPVMFSSALNTLSEFHIGPENNIDRKLWKWRSQGRIMILCWSLLTLKHYILTFSDNDLKHGTN